MILVLWGGLYAIEQVSGTWRNVGEAERILRGIPAGGEENPPGESAACPTGGTRPGIRRI